MQDFIGEWIVKQKNNFYTAYLKYSASIIPKPKTISKYIMNSKYLPPEPSFIFEYKRPKPEQATTNPIK